MKKFTTSLGIFFITSLVTFAANSLKPKEVLIKEGVFVNEEGVALQGEYEMRESSYDSDFTFKNGKLTSFSFESRKNKKNDLEVEGKFITPEIFKGEISIKTEEKPKQEETVNKKLSLDGTLAGKALYQFAIDVLTKSPANLKIPSFATEELTKAPVGLKIPTFKIVETWKLQDGKRELEEEKIVEVAKKEANTDYSMFQKTKTEEEKIFSKGKIVHTSKGSSSSSEMKTIKK